MAGLKYTYIPLSNATLVQRKFERDITPPGMFVLKNFLASRSDSVPTLRPDIRTDTNNTLGSFRTSFSGTSLDTEDDYLNSIFGFYGSDSKLYLTSRFAIDNTDDVNSGTYSGVEHTTRKHNIVDNGATTATAVEGSFLVTFSGDLNLNTDSYYGAIFHDDTNDLYYPIQYAPNKDSVVLENPIETALSADSFEIMQAHCPANANAKAHTELFLANTIYNLPILDQNYSTYRITGPYAGTTSVDEDYVAYTGYFTGWEEGDLTSMQTAYGEPASRKTGAAGDAIYVSVRPLGYYEGNDGTVAGPIYSLTPEVPSSFVLPIEGGDFDFNSKLPLTDGAYTGTSFLTKTINGDETIILYVPSLSKFYVPLVVTDGGGPAVQRLVIFEMTDDPATTSVANITDYDITLGTGGDSYVVTNMCYNTTDATFWLTLSGGGGGGDAGDTIVIVDPSDWTTTTDTLPAAINAYGLEYCETGNYTMICGPEGVDLDSHVYVWDGTGPDFTELNLPSSNPDCGACGIYDDGTSWVFIIPGSTSLCYWGAEQTDTIIDTGSTFADGYDTGMFFCASNGFVYSEGGADIYNTEIVLSGHAKIGICEVNPDDSSVSFKSLVSGAVDYGDGQPYTHKFQKNLFSNSYSKEYVSIAEWVVPPENTVSNASSVKITSVPGTYPVYSVDEFTPVSSIYRSKCFGIVNGYVVLFGLNEYDAVTDTWTFTPRRIRWTAPATVNDFSGTGSGTADVLGNGDFIDARTVNERIVMFETDVISTLVPRGIVDDPFDYEVIYRGLRIVSNPTVVNDIIYFVASDGLLWQTNGSSVSEVGASFDATSFDDFNEDRPLWLVYAPSINSLLVFYAGNDNTTAYVISMATGGVSSVILPGDANIPPKSIVTVDHSSDQDICVGYNPVEAYSYTLCPISKFDLGESTIGRDQGGGGEHSPYFFGEIQTGNLFSDELEEGLKVALKHIIIHTYTDASAVTYNPDIVVEVKSLEDSEWWSARDTFADDLIEVAATAATMSSSSPPSAFSNILGTANETAVTYNLPWIAANCRIYTKTGTTYTPCTLVTTTPDAANEYQITAAKQIKVYGTSGHIVYCFCDNEPFIRMGVDDFIEVISTGVTGLPRISTITNYITATLDRDWGTETTASHQPSKQIPIGHGKISFGVNKLVEGVKLRIRVVPRESGASTVVKIVGISLGYIPLGEKIVEATGG